MKKPINKLEKNGWPDLLNEINDPPEQLFKRGELPRKKKYLCVVGSRKHSSYGKLAVQKLIGNLKGYPIAIVSGLALGIDALAHKAALENNLRTIAVPGSGLGEKVLYPKSNFGLAKKILKNNGALLSEFEENFKATPYSFPKRNRIMAGMSHATLIIEAEEKSGTLITARLTYEYNRELLVVPGPINSRTSSGANKLILDGARPAINAEIILESLGLETEEKNSQNLELSNEEKNVIKILSEPMPKDELLKKMDIDASEANILLSSMELKGLIKEEMGKVYSQI